MLNKFKKKKLNPPKRVCLRLKELRQKGKVSLDELSKRTKISRKYLQALEECRFKDLPRPSVYQKNFVKSYVEALKVDPGPFLKQYIIEETVIDKKNKHPQKGIKQSRWHNLPLILRFTAVIVVVVAITIYLGAQVKHIVEPPKLTLYSPSEGYVTESSSLLIQGQTEKEVSVTINGKEIMNNEQGQFEEKIDLVLGVNTIIISAEKKHGKTTTEVRHVILKNAPTVTLEESERIID